MLLKRIYLSFLLICLLITPAFAQDNRVLVGFIPDGNFYQLGDNGHLSGYNYDYLQRLAQFTDLEFEFVIIEDDDLNQAYETARTMLRAGEIDLLGSHSYTSQTADLYEFGARPYSVVRSALCTYENSPLTRNNFFNNSTLRAVLLKDSLSYNSYFFEIMAHYGITPEITYVDTQAEAVALLKNQQADVMMSTDYSVYHAQLTILESANPVPLYFVSTLGNAQLMEQLDTAIAELETVNVHIIEQLQEKYFSSGQTGILVKTEREAQATEPLDYLTVGLLKGALPYQFYDDSNQLDVPAGISTEIIARISELIGVEFRYEWFNSTEEIIDKMQQQEVDLYATLLTDYALSKQLNLRLTVPYVSNGVVVLRREGSEIEYEQASYHFISDVIPFFDTDHLTALTDITSIIEDISANGDQLLFCDPYIAQYTLQALNIRNIEAQSVSQLATNVSLGVAPHIDPVIIGLINHAILHLDPYEVDEIIYRNLIVNDGITLEAFLYRHSFTIILLLLALFTIIVCVIAYHAKKFRDLSRRDGLTKLYNAGFFHRYGEDKVKKMKQGCLILIDIDYFKAVNDIYGHQTGDQIIIAVADTLRHHFRTDDVVARLGGDEFVVLVEYNASSEDLSQRSEQILQDLSNKDCDVPVTLSIGGYLFQNSMTYEQLYKYADRVLYQVKNDGRNNYKFASQSDLIAEESQDIQST